MAPPQRVRYNAKARGSQAGGSHKRKKRVNNDGEDSNAIEAVPKSGQQKEEERRERIRQELEAQSTSKMTSKKRKRMESYINKKLKKEERVKVLAKLAVSQSDLPTSLNLASSATLGTGRLTSHAERIDKSEDLAVRKAFDGGNGRRKRRRLDPTIHGDEDESGSDSDNGSVPESIQESPKPEPAKSTPSNISPKPSLGSALASSAPPRIIPRKNKSGISRNAWNPTLYNVQKETESESSFDSSDSANDTASEDEEDEEMDGSNAPAEDSNSDSGDEDSSSGAEDSGSGSDSDTGATPPPKRSFKAWAQQQIDISKGLAQPSTSQPTAEDEPPQPTPQPINFQPKLSRPAPGQYPGPLGAPLQTPSTSLLPSSPMKAPRVTVDRSEEIQATRLELPILAEEQEIVETVLLNSVVILSGETGSGKTTQVPQFLYEAGFGVPDSDNPGMIGITQPRRVAALSTASRVSHELNLPPPVVAHQVRYAKTTSPETRIKFMTDGVLLRELTGDLMLSRYSVVIVDEAHERGVNTDVLIGVLSRVVKLREKLWREGKEGVKPLRLIIMSATLRLSDFAQNSTLFSTPPPVISITTRQHPVTIHFDRRTRGDYVRAAETKVAKIHARLPPGGVLVFMTGQREIVELCARLEKRFGPKRKGRVEEKVGKDRSMGAAEGVVESEEVELGTRKDEVDDGEISQAEEDPDALDSDEESENEELQIDSEQSDVPMHIVPLYSLLPSDKQMKVFEPPPEGARLVVVATNVAETSLTIPGIRYVVDTGRAKERRFDSTSGLQSFDISWISKASAAQRSGRAGRTGPGHCYRLYSSALYESHFPTHAKPEIERMPVEGVVLQMKSMGIDAVVNFPFPTPPERESLRRAEVTLAHLGALAGEGKAVVVGGQVTPLGRAMSLFPVSPRFSKMLVVGRQKGCLPYVIAIAAALSVGDPFLREEAVGDDNDDGEEEDELELAPEFKEIRNEELRAKEVRKARRREFFKSLQVHSAFGKGTSDIFRWLSVIGAYEFEHNRGLGTLRKGNESAVEKFCRENFIRPKAMEEIHKLRGQIAHTVISAFPETEKELSGIMKPPSENQIKLLRQIITSGFIDQIAVRKDYIEKQTGVKRTSARGVPYQAIGVKEDVFIHPSSVLFAGPPPDFVAFQDVVRTSRVWLKVVTRVNPSWLPTLGPSLSTYSKPLKVTAAAKAGKIAVVPRFGPHEWELPMTTIDK
ncbi:Helicase associated domain (HA2) [Rhizoctonia solani]|uniref:RNA helicase n=1 Tax=Rhizoctonia solani TaxID=456999 RepID=A0A8H8SW81_9AGAM|nr:Helicase associated domain (HA2) [Rhizoctonia solani]QRW20054.1 Helicase associated domain (HA2) [Rhizoctonia solani]